MELLKTGFLPQYYGCKTTKHVCLRRIWRRQVFLGDKFSGLFLRESCFYLSFETSYIKEENFDMTFCPCVTNVQNEAGDILPRVQI